MHDENNSPNNGNARGCQIYHKRNDIEYEMFFISIFFVGNKFQISGHYGSSNYGMVVTRCPLVVGVCAN